MHYINIQFFYILLQCFDDQKKLFKEIKMPLMAQISKYAILTNYCVVMIPNNYEKIYFELSIVLKDGQNRSDIIKIKILKIIFILKFLKNSLDYSI